MARRLTLLVLCVVTLTAGSAEAQDDPRLRDVIAAVESAVSRTDFRKNDLWPELKSHLDALRESGRTHLLASEIASAALGQRRVAALARLPSGTVTPAMAHAIAGMRGIAGNELRSALQAIDGRDAATKALWPLTAFHDQLLRASLMESLEKLRRYERKFGPKSARLNGAEVAANYLAQRLPGFGPNAEGWPGAWEVVAAYSPTYMTYEDGNPQLASVGEAGLRRYFFGEEWGADGLKGLLRPAFMTFGVAVASEELGALKWPWKGDARIGGFVTWGEVKVAVVGGSNARVFVSRQFQLVPWAF